MSIALKRAAGEKRREAKQRHDALKSKLEKQSTNQLPEGESRLGAEEIGAEMKAINDLLKEATELEGVAAADDVLNRPDSDLSPGARDVKNSMQGGDGGGRGASGADNQPSVFGNMNSYLKAIRQASGEIDPDILRGTKALSQDQRKQLAFLKQQATRFLAGDPVDSMKDLGDVELKTLVGDDPGSTGRADYLVPPEHMGGLLKVMAEQQQFANRARRIPMQRRSVTFPRLVQDDETVSRPVFSFAAVTKLAEAAEKPAREPRFSQLTLTAVKYAAYLEASDELLVDSIVDLPPVLIDLLTSAISYEFDRDTMRGTGVGEPQGWLTSPATYAVRRTTANRITLADIFEMEARFFGSDGIYLFHQSAIPQIYALQNNNIVAWASDLSARVPGTLLGRPMVRTAKLPMLGTRGDFNLVDPSFYLVGEVQAVTIASSIHFRFRNDVTAWRAVYRGAGSPWPASTFAMEATGGALSYEVAPFITLDIPAV